VYSIYGRIQDPKSKELLFAALLFISCWLLFAIPLTNYLERNPYFDINSAVAFAIAIVGLPAGT
jgi:hypothetical protein